MAGPDHDLSKVNPKDDLDTEANHFPVKRTPLPLKQILTLMLVRIIEPISFTVIFPFVNEQVLRSGVTNDPERVGYYSGLIESIFAVAQFCFVMQWAALSDRWGRKPVIRIGLTGIALCGTLYGFQSRFWAMIACRAALGALNGIAAPLRAAMAEITDDTNNAEAFSLYAFVWQIGSIIGNCIGGSTSGKFDGNRFFRKYPYALPCVLTGGISVSGVALTTLVFEEALPGGSRASQVFFSSEYQSVNSSTSTLERCDSDSLTLVGDSAPQTPHGQDILTSSPGCTGMEVNRASGSTAWTVSRIARYPAIRLFLYMQHVHHLISTGFGAHQVLFFYTPVTEGGLGLSTDEIGAALMIQGVLIMLAQYMLVPWAKARFGIFRAFKISNLWFAIAILGYPILRLAIMLERGGGRSAADGSLSWTAWLSIIAWEMMASPLHLAGVYLSILTASYAPDPSALGTINGMSSAICSLGRVIGPCLFCGLFAVSTDRNILGGELWWIGVIVICLASSWLSSTLPNDLTRTPAEVAKIQVRADTADMDDYCDTPPTSASPLHKGR